MSRDAPAWDHVIGSGGDYALLEDWWIDVSYSNSANQHAICLAQGNLGYADMSSVATQPDGASYYAVYGVNSGGLTNAGSRCDYLSSFLPYSRFEDMVVTNRTVVILDVSNRISRCVVAPASDINGIYLFANDMVFNTMASCVIRDCIVIGGDHGLLVSAVSVMFETYASAEVENLTVIGAVEGISLYAQGQTEPFPMTAYASLEIYNSVAVDCGTYDFTVTEQQGGELTIDGAYLMDSDGSISNNWVGGGYLGTITHVLSPYSSAQLFQDGKDDLRLRFASPCINAGTNGVSSTRDVRNKGRPAYGRQDIGGSEYQARRMQTQ